MANAPGWEQLIQGLYIEAAQKPHIEILGNFFYAILLVQIFVSIYMKTEDFGTTLTVLFLISGSAAILLPVQTQGLLFLTILIGMAGIIYKLFV